MRAGQLSNGATEVGLLILLGGAGGGLQRTIDKSVDDELPVLLHQVVDVAEDSTVKKYMLVLEQPLSPAAPAAEIPFSGGFSRADQHC